jgi:N-acetylneuraminic acid mutarotase
MVAVRRRVVAAILILLVIGAVPALAAVVELPGEARLKRLVGVEQPENCRIVNAGGSGADWRSEPETPTLRDGPSAAVLGDRVVLVGGIQAFYADFTKARSLATVEVFDVASGRWSRWPDLPEPLNHVGIATVDGTLYALGGLTNEWRLGSASAKAWRFDEQRRRWRPLADMPTARGGAGIAVVGDRIYVAGGISKNVSLDAMESYDTRTGRWSEHAPMPTRRDHAGMTASGGVIYAAAGRREDERSLTVFERYDPRDDSWSTLPPLPEPKAGFVLAETPAGLVAAGGEDLRSRTLYGGVYAFDPDGGGWRPLGTMQEPKHGYGAAYVDGRLWVFGGSRCSGFKPTRSSASMPVG